MHDFKPPFYFVFQGAVRPGAAMKKVTKFGE
jgi:hypothetical protein